jgi:hypothetical protein
MRRNPIITGTPEADLKRSLEEPSHHCADDRLLSPRAKRGPKNSHMSLVSGKAPADSMMPTKELATRSYASEVVVSVTASFANLSSHAL